MPVLNWPPAKHEPVRGVERQPGEDGPDAEAEGHRQHVGQLAVDGNGAIEEWHCRIDGREIKRGGRWERGKGKEVLAGRRKRRLLRERCGGGGGGGGSVICG